MSVPIANPRTVENHRVIEESAVVFCDRAQFIEEVSELFNVESVDFCNFFYFFLQTLMMRDVMMPLIHINKRIRAVGTFVGEDEGGDASAVGLEGQRHHVEHEMQMFFVIFEIGLGGMSAFGETRHGFFGQFDSAFDFADGGEVFVELALIALADAGLEAPSVIGDEIEHAFSEEGRVWMRRRRHPRRRWRVAEETLENEDAGLDSGFTGMEGEPPCEVVLVGARSNRNRTSRCVCRFSQVSSNDGRAV